METSDKKLIFEINVDDPRQVAPGKVPKGPKGHHVGYKIVGKDLKIVGHILVDDVDAYRPQVK